MSRNINIKIFFRHDILIWQLKEDNFRTHNKYLFMIRLFSLYISLKIPVF
jgi:hypothetical protein